MMDEEAGHWTMRFGFLPGQHVWFKTKHGAHYGTVKRIVVTKESAGGFIDSYVAKYVIADVDGEPETACCLPEERLFPRRPHEEREEER